MKLNKVDDKTAYENLLIKYAELERLNSNQAESLRVIMLEEEKKRKRIEELEQENADQKDQLTKAREILQLFIGVDGIDDFIEVRDKAEQFLKEIE